MHACATQKLITETQKCVYTENKTNQHSGTRVHGSHLYSRVFHAVLLTTRFLYTGSVYHFIFAGKFYSEGFS